MSATSNGAGAAQWFAERLPSLEQLDEILGDDPVAALAEFARSRAPVEVAFATPPEVTAQFTLAAAAARRLQGDPSAPLSAAEVQALHAFAHLVTRPSLRVVNGDPLAAPDTWPAVDQGRPVLRRLLRGVGRLDTASRVGMGTGWFVAPGLVLTNNHVLAALCDVDVHGDPRWRVELDRQLPTYQREWSNDPTKRPRWDPAEVPGVGTMGGRVRRARALHPSLDAALLEVEGVPDSGALALPIAAAAPRDPSAQPVYVLGYPQVGDGLGVLPAVHELLFGNASAAMIKRVAPGRLLRASGAIVEHDASTLGGSSGSPVIDFDTHRAVGLHFSGTYGVANAAVALWELRDDPFFRDNGVTFAAP